MISTKIHTINPYLKVVTDSNFLEHSFSKGTFWLRSNFSEDQIARLKERLEKSSIESINDVQSFLLESYGNFSVIVNYNNFLFASVDKVRTYPIYFSHEDSTVFVSGRPRVSFEERIDKGEETWTAISMSSYSLGRKTLDKKVKALRAGEFLFLNDNLNKVQDVEVRAYYYYKPWLFNQNFETKRAKEQLTNITLKLFEEISKKHSGKTIIIPLSAGVDSRLIASGMKELGLEKVECISYGLKGNFEAEAARNVAEQLGYKWSFIELNKNMFAQFKASPDYKNYHFFTESLISVPFYQDIVALHELKKTHNPSETVIINGNSGDYISGAHILKSMSEKTDRKIVQGNVIQETINKHFSLWKSLQKKENLLEIEKQLESEIEYIYGIDSEIKPEWAIYEALEFLNRQTKYVISGQWNYDFLGFSWELPLWSEEYLFFWEKVPFEAKFQQKLYKEWVIENNWGGVWKDIPINQKFPQSYSIRLFRLLAKLACAPFGKKKWHSMEKRLFAYHTEILGLHGDRKYKEMLFEKDEPRNILSWLTRDYLSELEPYGR